MKVTVIYEAMPEVWKRFSELDEIPQDAVLEHIDFLLGDYFSRCMAIASGDVPPEGKIVVERDFPDTLINPTPGQP